MNCFARGKNILKNHKEFFFIFAKNWVIIIKGPFLQQSYNNTLENLYKQKQTNKNNKKGFPEMKKKP